MTTVHSELGADFDPWSRDHLADPIAVYDRMREVDPVHWNERRKLWFVTRYGDVMSVLKDPEHLSAARWQVERPHMEQSKSGEYRQPFVTRTMLQAEPPDHTRLRSAPAPAFTPRAIRRLEAAIEGIADRLLDAICDQPEWDIIRDYAFPLPLLAVAALLGVPAEAEAEFIALARSDEALLAIDPLASMETLDHHAREGAKLGAFVDRIIEETPSSSDDLIGTLLGEHEAGRWTMEEVRATCHLMMEAGHVTTVNLIGNGIDLFLQDPSRIARLVSEPALARSAVEECLRYDGPVHWTGRTALVDVEVGGRVIKEGEIVITLFPAANRDPEEFPDPHSFVIDRSPNNPVVFGAGIHHCIGANLARVEAAVAFRKLFERYPDLARAGEPVRYPTFELRGFESLPVRSRPA